MVTSAISSQAVRPNYRSNLGNQCDELRRRRYVSSSHLQLIPEPNIWAVRKLHVRASGDLKQWGGSNANRYGHSWSR